MHQGKFFQKKKQYFKMIMATNKNFLPVLKRGLIAILRGIKPEEAQSVAGVLIESGFDAIEVPLNSPSPLHSIERISHQYGDKALIGAGTVLTPEDVDNVVHAGGRLIISPNIEPKVVERAASLDLVSMPGVLTPTEAHLALRCGASCLKFFPASVLGPEGIGAIMSILPANTLIGAVGGIGSTSFASYAKIGIKIFGIGSSLYKPGDNITTIKEKADIIVKSYDILMARPNNTQQ